MKKHVYRLTPAAAPDDTNWDLASNQGTIVVRALSAGDARTVAAHAEAAAMGEPKGGVGMTQTEASAFWNPLLYNVARDASGMFSDEGPRQVLQGEMEAPRETIIARD